MYEVVQIIPLGIERDRIVHLLKKFPPHRVYLLRNSDPAPEHKKMELIVDKLQKEFDGLLPLAKKYHIKTNYADFKENFIKFLKIMKKEKDRKSEVIVNICSSKIVSFAAWLAASLTKSKVYYIQAKVYGLKDEFSAKGIAKMFEMIHFPIILPDKTESEVLKYLIRKKGKITVKLRDLVRSIGFEKLGIKTIQSGIVKMSYCLRKLEERGYVEIKTVSRKRQRVILTESGDIMANASEILED